MTTYTTPTVAERIERILASLPELCGNCQGTGYIDTDERDDGVMHVGHAPCPVCRDDDDPPPPRMPRR